MTTLGVWLWWACARAPAPDVEVPDAPSDSAEVDDPFGTDDTPPRVPLCDEVVVPRAVAPDLDAWAARVKQSDNPFFGEALWRNLESLGEDHLGSSDQDVVENRLRRGFERLKFGDIDGAIADLQAGLDRAELKVPSLRGRARQLLAVAWMRKAELQNCVADGTGAACLVPFGEEAQHRLTEGMTEASAVLVDLLEDDDPGALGPLWLLNVAQMALGAYPDGVPEPWRVDPALLVSPIDLPAWANVAPWAIGPEATLAGGAAIDDFDGDGRLDLLTSSMELAAGMRLLLQREDGTFCDASAASGVSAIPGVLSFNTSDYDNDGDLDVLAPRGGWFADDGRVRPSLLRNDGEGRFTDVAIEAGLADEVGPSQAAAWADVDGDGWLDLFFGREAVDSGVAPSSLYMNQGDGTFRDVAAGQPLREPGFVKGCVFGDVDGDGDPDLYVSTRGGLNHLYRNDAGVFVDVTREERVEHPHDAFASAFFDYDQDGDEDLVVMGYDVVFGQRDVTADSSGRSADGYVADLLGLPASAETHRLYRNDGGHFTDVTRELGLAHVQLAMGMNVGDLDADGWPDLYIGTGAPAFEALEPNAAWRNSGGARFDDVTFATYTGHLQKGHGVAFGDLDEDGDEDLLAEIGGAYLSDAFPDALFENPSDPPGSLTLRLRGTASNRSAIGARVRIVTDQRTWHRVVGTGGSFGANSLQVEVPLDRAAASIRIEIDWPSGAHDTVDDVEVDSVVEIEEGNGVVATRPTRRTALPRGEHP
ncbi:MAG TPA: CRTAC1 family protein [Myxococcota bacterium]|nr:CRTAC1 family protein [Myxococcota bacterium]